MNQSFDLVVIGTGAAASTVASRCRAAGWAVAIADKRPFGGTCALRGCDPKKVLVGAADVIMWAWRMSGKGIHTHGLRIDWPELMRFKRTFTQPVPQAREHGFEKAGIAVFHGAARFTGPHVVQIGDHALEAKHIVIATGLDAAPLDIPGAESVITSDMFLELDDLPDRILFIGGGYISCEFAHIASAAGAETTIVHQGATLLEEFDPDLVSKLVEGMRQSGIRVELNLRATAIEHDGQNPSLTASRNDHVERFKADIIVHGAGRIPDIGDLNLPAANVEWETKGVTVNEFLQSTSNPAVYAAGDVAASGNPPLTPLAGYEGQVVADNLLGKRRTAKAGVIPTVAFTNPFLASVGLSEEVARSLDLKFRTRFEDTVDWYASRRVAESQSGFKVLIEEDSGRILGAHLLGHNADEIINIFAMAIRYDITADELKEMIFAYPTHASNIGYML